MDTISSSISKDWVGLILLPAISSVAGFYLLIYSIFYATSQAHICKIECLSAVKVSAKDELTLSVSVAIGSTIVGVPCFQNLQKETLILIIYIRCSFFIFLF